MRKWGIARFVAARICYKLKMRRRYARKWRKMEEKKYDLVIIGAGPAGLSAAVYGVRAGLELVVLEKAPMSGGQVLNTYEVDNYLGLPGINGFDMGMQFRAHADRLGVAFQEADVKSIIREKELFVIETDREKLWAKSVVYGAGAEHAKLGVSGEDTFAGHGVSYCATCDGAFFRGKEVAVTGGGDVALEDAIYLARFCKKVWVIHRRDSFRGAAVLQRELLALSNVEVLYSHVVEEICGGEEVESLRVKNLKNGEEKKLPLSGVFVAVGIRPRTELLHGLAERDEAGYVIAGEDGKTETPGLFVAGDVRKKPLRQIVTAVADGANAAMAASDFVKGLFIN